VFHPPLPRLLRVAGLHGLERDDGLQQVQRGRCGVVGVQQGERLPYLARGLRRLGKQGGRQGQRGGRAIGEALQAGERSGAVPLRLLQTREFQVGARGIARGRYSLL